jgi:hypothetical protein
VRAVRIGALLAVALLGGLAPAVAPSPVAAARPDLSIVTDTTYDVLPDEGRVAVTVELTATNHLRDTVTRRYFFRTGFLSVLPGSSRFRISGGNGNARVKVVNRTNSATNLRIDFGRDLPAGRSTRLTLTFDLRDPGGAPDRPVRVGSALVTFTVWAFATPDTPGSSVDVRLPVGYDVALGRGPLEGPVPDGATRERWSSGTLDAPLEFIADVAASRAVEPLESTQAVSLAEGEATVVLRHWPDDTEWRDRVAGLVQRALPILEREIGVPWPVGGPLAVEETLVRGPSGYAGIFDPAERRVEISYAAPDAVVLHELAHAWFNGSLVADRWAAEAFASYYADLAATELGVEPAVPPPASLPEPQEPPADGDARIPLNAWGPSEGETPETEAYAYAASVELARAVAERAGEDGLRRVWALAARGIGAYRVGTATGEASADEPVAGPPDWRGLLDLLEDETGADIEDLWRTYVVRPDDLSALEARSETRAAYAASIELAGDWRLPASIREAMRAWRFDLAQEALAETDAVLAQRLALEAAAAEANLTLPGRVREAFEGAGPAAAAAEATAEQAVVDAIVAASDARPRQVGVAEDLLVQAGLIGTRPDELLAASKDALSTGDLEAAFTSAEAARGVWESAADVGRSRIVSAALLALALILFIGLVRQARSGRVRTAGLIEGIDEPSGLEGRDAAPPGGAPGA